MEIRRIIVGMLQTNCYLLIENGELAIVDPGDNAELIEQEISKSGAKPKYIVNTHCHFDHTGANSKLENKFKVKIESNLKEGDILFVGSEKLKAIKTPGHSPDSICLFGSGFVISGDTIFADGIGRTDLAGGSDQEMAQSLRKFDQLTRDDATVYPGHGDTFKYKKGVALGWLEYLE